ncbi:MAG: hypothetical protein A3J46_02370 [Candidatus Yanofskybacteria bacterium RIFCSPHIGHO2_02_FULL_41_11]|uniref:Phosphoglycerate mutase n=1 Tax=Candidatus Yanofskybacteria bacterium RIFCSPHIGHO2_02_FULL_41_11 TaxID=1802675 RepID=A0A1F8F8R5_9BACT|nr:MAG: hypothetical protein A3J46_02370 [Candidatus Yanofskybacteria bacterium RIFCSPHIGHO2_02_FULL_41_11]
MNNNIFIMRHGQDEDNAAGILNGRRDTPLTKLGQEQAKIAAQKLIDNKIDIIYASPLKRAYETARIVANELGVDEVVLDDHLIERDFGILTGKPVADIKKYTDKVLETEKITYFLEVEGAEDFPALLERGKKILAEIQERHSDSNILIVCHGDIGKMIRAAYHNIDWETSLKTYYFDNTQVLELSKDKDIIE